MELFGQQIGDRLLLVDREGKNIGQDGGFGEAGRRQVNVQLAAAGLDQVFGVVAIQDGEAGLVAEQGGVAAQNAVADGMEGAPPKGGEFAAEQVADAPHHFLGGFVGEGEKQDALRGDALFEQKSGAIGERARFARAGPRDHQRRAGRRRHRRVLLPVQLPLVVDVQLKRRTKGLYNVIARHGE